MSDNGWIKLYRELIDKPIWINSTPEQNRILITLLCMANHKPGTWVWNGTPQKVNAGQFITSVQSIIDKCKCKSITRQKVRTALEKFEKYGFLTIETNNQSTLVTVVNWQYYQENKSENNQHTNQQITNEQPTDNQQITTNKNKECKNDKNEKKESVYKHPLGEQEAGTDWCSAFVPPTVEEVTEYCNGAGITIDCEKFVNHYNSVGWTVNGNIMRNWKARARNWYKQDQQKLRETQQEVQRPKGVFNNYSQRTYSEEEIEEILRRKGST